MSKPESVKEGCLIFLDLKPAAVTGSYYIGLTKTADEHGIRMNPLKWDELTGKRFSKEEIYIPWVDVKSALVCADK